MTKYVRENFVLCFVQPILEFSVDVWDPHIAGKSRRLERVQRKFLRFVSYLLKTPSAKQDYSPSANMLFYD